jgi:rod shape-determining protein MreC
VALSRRSRSSRSRYTLALLVLTSITLLTLDFRGFGPLETARSGVLGFFAPVGDAAESVFSPVADAWNGAFGYDELARENEELRQRVIDLEGDVGEAERAAERLEELRALEEDLGLEYMDDLEVVNASVVSSGVGNFDATIEIDRGANDGVEVGHPVVAGRGLIGQVVRVSDTRSAVRLVTDPKFQVGVRVAGRPGLGIVSGQGNETRLRATSFDLTTELREGDLLVTSGAARSLFPPEVPVGRVTEVTSDEASLQQEADVEIIPRLNDLLYVTVVRWVPDEPRWDEAP